MSKHDIGIMFGDDDGYYWIIQSAEGFLPEVVAWAVKEVMGSYENSVSIIGVFPGVNAIEMEKTFYLIMDSMKFVREISS